MTRKESRGLYISPLTKFLLTNDKHIIYHNPIHWHDLCYLISHIDMNVLNSAKSTTDSDASKLCRFNVRNSQNGVHFVTFEKSANQLAGLRAKNLAEFRAERSQLIADNVIIKCPSNPKPAPTGSI